MCKNGVISQLATLVFAGDLLLIAENAEDLRVMIVFLKWGKS